VTVLPLQHRPTLQHSVSATTMPVMIQPALDIIVSSFSARGERIVASGWWLVAGKKKSFLDTYQQLITYNLQLSFLPWQMKD